MWAADLDPFRRNWRYSKEGLQRVRRELNVTAVERVRSMVEEERVEEEKVRPAVNGPSGRIMRDKC